MNYTDQELRNANPWQEREGFVELGFTRIGYGDGRTVNYQYYALEGPDKNYVGVGARFGIEPEDYMSGEISMRGGRQMVHDQTAIAATMYLVKKLGGR